MERKSRLIDALENAAWRSGSTFTHELANKRAIRCSSILLPRIEDAALKFRGCFQAICELRSENQQGEDQRVVCTSRQGVVVLEPIYPTSLLRHISLSLSSSRSFPSFLFAPTSPHFLSHFHCLVTVHPRPPFVCSAYGGAEKRTVTSSCPFDSS